MTETDINTMGLLCVGIATAYGLYVFPRQMTSGFSRQRMAQSVAIFMLVMFCMAITVARDTTNALASTLIFTVNGLVVGYGTYYWQARKKSQKRKDR